MSKLKVALLVKGAVAGMQLDWARQNHEEGSPLRNTVNVTCDNYVNYTASYKSTKKYIVNVNKNMAEFDFFIHSWNTDLENELVELYNPIKYKFEDNAQYEQLFSSLLDTQSSPPKPVSTGGWPFAGGLPWIPERSIGQVSWAFSMKKGIELIESVNIDYDYVIICRLDTLLMTPMHLGDYDNKKIYANKHKPEAYRGSTVVGPAGDFRFVMNLKNASKFKNLFDSLSSGNEVQAHLWVKNYVVNYMKDGLHQDNILAGVDEEILRKAHSWPKEPSRYYSDFVEFGLIKNKK